MVSTVNIEIRRILTLTVLFGVSWPEVTQGKASLVSLMLQTEIEAIRDDIAPTWLQHPLSLEQTADKFVRPSLQRVGDPLS